MPLRVYMSHLFRSDIAPCNAFCSKSIQDLSLTCHGVYYIYTTKYIVFYNLVHVDIVVKEIITPGE